MILKVTLSLLVFSLLEEISIEGSECLPDLENLAVYEGSKNILMNLTTDTNDQRWTIIPSSNENDVRYIQEHRDRMDPELTGLFYLNQNGLVILNATTTEYGGPISTAGLYIAGCANSNNETGAKLVVVRAAPECSCNISSSETIKLSCSIYYADTTMHAIYATMTWNHPGGSYIFATETPPRTRKDYVFESTSTFTVPGNVDPTFTCTVTFDAPTDIVYEFIATNAPQFSASCTVAVRRLENDSLVCIPTTTTQPPTTISSTECLPILKNTAVYEGDKNTMMNQTDPNNAKWSIIPSSDEFGYCIIWEYGVYADPPLTGLYYINQSGLVIFNATTTPNGDPSAKNQSCNEQPISTAGLYIAECANNENMTGAKLVVVRAAPECSCNVSSSETVQLSCSIYYADTTLHSIYATMTWKLFGEHIFATETPPRTRKDYVYESTSTYTVPGNVPPIFTCTVTFDAPTDIVYEFIATNAPEFSASCSVAGVRRLENDSLVCIPTTTTTQPPTEEPSTTISTTDTLTTTTQPPTAEPSTTTSTTTTTQPPTTEPSTTISASTTTTPTSASSTASTTSTSTSTPPLPPLPTTTTSGLLICILVDILNIFPGPDCLSYCISKGFSGGTCVPSSSVKEKQCRCF